MLIGNFMLLNQLIPLPINDYTDVSRGNGVSVSESEVSVVSGVDCKERVIVANASQKVSQIPFL